MIFFSLLLSLALTCIIEVPILYSRKIPLKIAFAANILTNPVVVLLYNWAIYFKLPIIAVIALLELSAVAVEGYFFKGYCKKPWLLSLIVNGISFSIGLLLF